MSFLDAACSPKVWGEASQPEASWHTDRYAASKHTCRLAAARKVERKPNAHSPLTVALLAGR
eukprot:1703592-Prymnesium_polylepis.1